MINYDRVNKRVLLQFPDGHGLYTKHPGAVLQMTSDDFGQTWSDPVDISAMLGPSFSPGKHKYLHAINSKSIAYSFMIYSERQIISIDHILSWK